MSLFYKTLKDNYVQLNWDGMYIFSMEFENI